MYAALRINDILREIFIHIHEDSHSHKTAYHAAFVCKQFSPHALDVLWFSLDALAPLVALIPNSIIAPDSESLSFTTLPTKDDLSVFDLYACRVKEICLPIKYGISVPIMTTLLEILGRPCLLPNLRMLKHGSPLLSLNESDCFFLCSKLKHVKFQGREISFFLARLVQASPSIQHLELVHESIPSHLLSLLKHLRLLEALQSRNKFVISPASFPSSFPFAEHLTTWHASSIGFCADDTVCSSVIEFPVLTTLALTEPVSTDELVNLFSQSFFPKLQTLSLCAPTYNYDSNRGPEYGITYKASLLRLFPLLFKKRHSLKFLEIKGDGREDGSEDTEMDLGDFFADVEWQTLWTFRLEDAKLLKPLTLASIDRLCTTFPMLHSLTLRLYDTYHISFDHLAVLVDRLPLLYDLDIGIDTTELANPPSVPILSHHLRILCVDGSEIRDGLLFARYVDRLFPSVVIQEIPYPTEEEELLMAAHKLVRECRQNDIERSIQKPIRKKQTARRGRA